MLTLATKKLSSGANGQKEVAASFFCPRSFDRAVMQYGFTGNSMLAPRRGYKVLKIAIHMKSGHEKEKKKNSDL